MIGDVVMSSMDPEPLSKEEQLCSPKPFWVEGRKGDGLRGGKGMGLILKPLDSGTPYGIRLRYGFALLRASD